jgi:hypothetical protein
MSDIYDPFQVYNRPTRRKETIDAAWLRSQEIQDQARFEYTQALEVAQRCVTTTEELIAAFRLANLGYLEDGDDFRGRISNQASPIGMPGNPELCEDLITDALSHTTNLHLYLAGSKLCPGVCPQCRYTVEELAMVLQKKGQTAKEYFDNWVQLLITETRLKKERYTIPDCVHIDSMYIGGGTPSLLSVDQITLLIDGIIALGFVVDQDTELTLEVYPSHGTVNFLTGLQNRIGSICKLRVSIGGTGGVDASDDQYIKGFGRKHNAEDIMKAITRSIALQIPHVTTDVIIGMNPEKRSPKRVIEIVQKLLETFGDKLAITTYSLEQTLDTCSLQELYATYIAIKKIMSSAGRRENPMGVGGAWWEKVTESITRYILDRWFKSIPVLGIGRGSYTAVSRGDGKSVRQSNYEGDEYELKVARGEIPTDPDKYYQFDNYMLEIMFNFHYSGKILLAEGVDDRVVNMVGVLVSHSIGQISEDESGRYYDIDSGGDSVIQLGMVMAMLGEMARSASAPVFDE